ncbi:MAG: V-type ATPase subunit [Gemmatimonadales bacterium]|jgi:vacuolar-type H+-ATPase subunit C/Vma6
MTWWADANTRAAGLSGHLLDEAEWTRVRACADLGSLLRELQRLGYDVQPGETPRSAELALERTRIGRCGLLVRWLGPRIRSLRLHLEADVAREVRVLLRVAAAGTASPESAGDVPPTDALPAGLRAAALAAGSPEDVLRVLAERGQPLAERARAEHRELVAEWPGLPPLLACEQALLRAHVGRALEGLSRRDRALRDRVRRAIDLLNLRAVLSAGPESRLPAAAIFLSGGDRVDLQCFRRALEAPDRRAARELLAHRLPERLAAPLTNSAIPVTRLGRALLEMELDEERALARREPLGPAPVLAFLLRQRLEVRDLRGLVWARALGAPPDPERWA